MKRRLIFALLVMLVLLVVWRAYFVANVDESTEFTSSLVRKTKWRSIVSRDLSDLQIHRVQMGAMFTSTGKWSDMFQEDPAVDVQLLFNEKESMTILRGNDLIEFPAQAVFRRKRKIGKTEVEYVYGIQGSVYRDTREFRLQATVDFVDSTSPQSSALETASDEALHLYEHLSYLSDKQALRLQVAERVGDEVRHLIVHVPIAALEIGTLPKFSESERELDLTPEPDPKLEPELEFDPIFD